MAGDNGIPDSKEQVQAQKIVGDNGVKERVQALDDLVNSDLTAKRNEYFFRTPFLVDMLKPLMRDPRDEPMLCLQLNIVQFMVPGVLTVYGVCGCESLPLLLRNFVGVVYVAALVVLFFERFILMLHFSSHRAMFKNDVLSGILVWAFAPFFGVPSGVYKLHHVVMHHIENNHYLDTSSTEEFQRDAWSDFFRYWVRFVLLIHLELPYYCLRTKKYEHLTRLATGLLSQIFITFILAKHVSALGTLWVFGVPHLVAMSAMCFGNWSQHIFVDPQNASSNYALTYNCIDTPGNQTTFNDGYHIIHHQNARLHWTELPGYFHDNKETHQKNGAVTFRGIHFFDVGVLVMTKQLKKLARHYVHLGSKETAPTVEAIEERLRTMLLPVSANKKAA